MPESSIVLTGEERDYLDSLLENVLKEKRIEEHRTRAPSYREHVLQEEAIITCLLGKVRQACVQNESALSAEI